MHGQSIEQKWVDENVLPIAINPSDTNYKDLQFLKELIGDKPIVLIGESYHRTSEFPNTAVRLVKFLHKELNFDVLIEEVSFFQGSMMHSYVRNKNELKWFCTTMDNSRSLCQATNELAEYTWNSWGKRDSLHLAGMDVFLGINKFYAFYMDSILYRGGLVQVNHAEWKRYLEYIQLDLYGYSEIKKGYDFYEKMTDNLILQLSNKPTTNSLLIQQLKSSKGFYKYVAHGFRILKTKNVTKGYFEIYQYRDQQMFDNFEWLITKRYPGKKVVVFASAFHTSRNIVNCKNGNQCLKKVVPVGQYIWDKYQNQTFSIALLPGGGKIGYVYEDPGIVLKGRIKFKNGIYKARPTLRLRKYHDHKEIRSLPKNSIEYLLNRTSLPTCYLDLTKVKDNNDHFLTKPQKMASTIQRFCKVCLPNVYDGLLFVKTVTPNYFRSLYKLYNEDEVHNFFNRMSITPRSLPEKVGKLK